MDYKKYQEARNASWELILDLGIDKLPVKITSVLKALEIPVCKYSQNELNIQELGYSELMVTSDGFTVLIDDLPHVFYNDEMPSTRCRFTLAHELGHIMCGHLSNSKCVTIQNKEPTDTDSYEEQQANVFASRLLAPACVLHELKLFTIEQIAETCQISVPSAEFRLKRLLVLEERNKEFIIAKGYGCYYLSELEKQVYKQFKSYIDNIL